MRITRMPPISTVGDKISWLQLDSRAPRQWAMIPMALALGVNIGEFLQNGAAAVLPIRKVMGKVNMPPEYQHIYVGQGHYTHRQPTTKW